jgi:hypothetical protein
MNNIDMDEFLEAREAQRQRCVQEQELIKHLRTNTPLVRPLWDKSEAAVIFNDIGDEILKSGLLLYSASLVDVWQGLYRPDIYDGNTLWDDLHSQRKIALVINSWLNKKPLTPPFFVKHLKEPLGLVADGKHRLTVARYMVADELPFWVKKDEANWVTTSIPNAVLEIEI